MRLYYHVRCDVCELVWTKTPDIQMWAFGYAFCPRDLWSDAHQAAAKKICEAHRNAGARESGAA